MLSLFTYTYSLLTRKLSEYDPLDTMVSKLGTGSSNAEDLEQELRDAAKRGDIGEVARLIESGVSVNAKYVPDVSEVSRRKLWLIGLHGLSNGTWWKQDFTEIRPGK